MKNKKAFELVWNTWVVLVLAILILAFLVLFFTSSSSSFMNNIKSYFSKTNVDSVKKSCEMLANTGSYYEFCCESKDIKYTSDGKIKSAELTCMDFYKDILQEEISGDFNCDNYCKNDESNLNEQICEDAGGGWNECGNICQIENQGKEDVFCTQMCDSICECGTIAGLNCPEGYYCSAPENLKNTLGYCKKNS